MWNKIWTLFVGRAGQTVAGSAAAAGAMAVFYAFCHELAPWVFDTAQWVSAVRDGYAAFFTFIYAYLPSGAQSAIVDFVGMATDARVQAIFRLAWWVLDWFMYPSVVAGALGAYFLLFPVAGATRLGLMIYHQFWGSN